MTRWTTRLGIVAAAVFAATQPVGAEPAAVARGLVAHRAVYEMTLARRADRADVAAASGRLVYEFSGNACEGWSSRFRLVLQLGNSDGTARVTDMRTSSFEDGAGKSFEFVNQNLIDGQTVEDTKGKARREGDATRATIAAPAGRSFDLPGSARFPTEHMVALLEAAMAGRAVAEIDLYDGTEGGSRYVRTTVVVGREQTGADDTGAEPAAVSALTEGRRRWPVDISYFDPNKSGGDATPEYQLGFLVYDNGVSRRLSLDYGDFALAGRLSSLEALPSGRCE